MIVILAVMIATTATAGAADACLARIPVDLKRALANVYPQYRLPLGSDQDPSDVEAYGRGTGCLGVATGDFDGDSRMDIALLLSGKERLRTRLVVALREGDHWHLELIGTIVASIDNQYIHPIGPGTYESGFDQRRINSSTDGFATGTLNATTHYFFRLKGRWTSFWMAD